MNNSVTELQNFLYEKHKQVCRKLSADQPETNIIFKPDFDMHEAKYFISGMENGLFSIDDEGYAQSHFLPMQPKGKKQRAIQLFWTGEGGSRRLFREGVCQLSTASSLVLEYGWATEQVKMESAEFPDLPYAIDILIKSMEGKILACCEVKKDDREFQKLIKGFEDCCKRGPHSKEDCEYGENHAKYAFCLSAKPALFWFVAPGQEKIYKLSYQNGNVDHETVAISMHKERVMEFLRINSTDPE